MAPPSIPGDKPTIDMFDEVVNIIVGSGSNVKIFTVHKGLLSHYSGYFDKALNGKFKEARTKEIVLPEEEIKVFEHFVVWLYKDTIVTHDFDNICKLWIMADRRDVPLLMNAALDLMRDEIGSTWTVPTTSLRLIYADTTEGSQLRRFVVHAISRIGGPQLLTSEAQYKWPSQALWDVLRSVWGSTVGRMSKDEFAQMGMCDFHRHEDGVRCANSSNKKGGEQKSTVT